MRETEPETHEEDSAPRRVLEFHQPGIRPGTDDLHIVTNDAAGGQGGTIFHARAFARAAALLAAVNHSRTGAACDSADFAPSDRTAVAASTLLL